ncbi:unnamed protein product [Rotaria magnacalcarata]|uniref:Uncharacterized protein n=1 Tax=Rotaria magnacalcarata TaxID=392030 RepID=A0A816MNV4_9BILA|nr:unnamed protein product [Rotaria magnacalcarata]
MKRKSILSFHFVLVSLTTDKYKNALFVISIINMSYFLNLAFSSVMKICTEQIIRINVNLNYRSIIKTTACNNSYSDISFRFANKKRNDQF